MTYMLLREKLEKIENIEHILALFKVNVENNTIKLNQDCKIEECNYGQPDEAWIDSEIEEFQYKWKEISSECIFDLYNKMGWDISELANKKSALYSSDAECKYVAYYLSDAWMKINKLNDDYEFFYAMISLIQGIDDNEKQQVYRYIKYPIIKFLKEYDLYFILEEEESRTVFIAMSFDKTMIDARKTIMKVIKDAGYKPIIMDMKEHNNQIVPEMLYEIKKSKFLVADLTQHKTGVYYEIGYAEALGKESIVCCNSSDAEKTHFDVAQKNIVTWIDEKDLETRLLKRIKATVGNFFK